MSMGKVAGVEFVALTAFTGVFVLFHDMPLVGGRVEAKDGVGGVFAEGHRIRQIHAAVGADVRRVRRQGFDGQSGVRSVAEPIRLFCIPVPRLERRLPWGRDDFAVGPDFFTGDLTGTDGLGNELIELINMSGTEVVVCGIRAALIPVRATSEHPDMLKGSTEVSRRIRATSFESFQPTIEICGYDFEFKPEKNPD